MDSLKHKVQVLESEEIRKALEDSDWVMARAARKLAITERMISYKVRKYGITRGGDSLIMARQCKDEASS